MHLHYFRSHQNNFGDALNAWLWDALLADRARHAENVWLCGIGTILNHTLPRDRPMVIMSSGVGYGPAPIDHAGNWDIAAVRGPLSARCLGLDREKAVTDGAMLLSLLPDLAPAAPIPSRSGTVFMPHYATVDCGAWAQACAIAGIEFVDPRTDSRTILAKIRSARLVIANAMHGAIVADVVRTPWVAAAFDLRSSSFKWTDWCLSMGIRHQPHVLPASTLCEAVRHRALPPVGDDLPHPAQTTAAQAQQFRRANRATGHCATLYYRKIATRAVHEIATHLGTLEQRLAPQVSQRRIAQAASVLRTLANAPPVLSNDSVFHRQRERMAGALHAMAARYGLALHGGLAL